MERGVPATMVAECTEEGSRLMWGGAPTQDKRDSHDVTMSTDVHSNPNRVSRPAGVPGLDLTRLAPPFGYMRPQPLEVADTNQVGALLTHLGLNAWT
jgi:hypothetical protein